MSSTDWDPQQYLKFGDHRLRPGLELLDRVPIESPRVIYDLGCGTGRLTGIISDRWSDAHITGLDNSSDMLKKARSEPNTIAWELADISDWSPSVSPDLIYSNAALQWVEDHAILFTRLATIPNPGGAIAIQMPLSWGMPSHRLMRETLASENPDGGIFGNEALRESSERKWVDETDAYYDLLTPLTSSLDIWETQYFQVLEGKDPVYEWVKGTGLRPILDGLEGGELENFIDVYKSKLRDAYPQRGNGKTLYPFRRLFIVATV